MNSGALQLWFAYPGDLAEPGAEEACVAVLDQTERARAARFKFERHRREYIATHTLTRAALSHAHPLPPQSWGFSCNKFGKPSPVPECGLGFNQSNSVELTVCLVVLPHPIRHVAGDVGVDVESLTRAADIVPLASRVFSAVERAQLDALPAAERPDRALLLWTLKEAYIKARGMGLSLPLQKISFLFDGRRLTDRRQSALQWNQASTMIPRAGGFAGSTMRGTAWRWRLKRPRYAPRRSSRLAHRLRRQRAWNLPRRFGFPPERRRGNGELLSVPA